MQTIDQFFKVDYGVPGTLDVKAWCSVSNRPIREAVNGYAVCDAALIFLVFWRLTDTAPLRGMTASGLR